MNARAVFSFIVLVLLSAEAMAGSPEAKLSQALDRGALDRGGELGPLRTVIVSHQGRVLAERGYRGHSVTDPTNIKSASKSIISALVGIAIDKGVLEGVDQKIGTLLEQDLPRDPDPRLADITIGHLLSMQAGLERTSGGNYGAWISSSNWVRDALGRPFVDEPGGGMLYSTGSSHVLSAILTRATGRSTLELARDWLGPLDGFSIASWERDPQGIYLGGNQMAMSARSLLAFGDLYRNGGRTPDGQQLVSPGWIEASWQPRTKSRFTGDGYGYGWFLRRIGGHDVRYAWGYGGQMIYIVPDLELTVVMTSDADSPAGRSGHRDRLHELVRAVIEILKKSGGHRDSASLQASRLRDNILYSREYPPSGRLHGPALVETF